MQFIFPDPADQCSDSNDGESSEDSEVDDIGESFSSIDLGEDEWEPD